MKSKYLLIVMSTLCITAPLADAQTGRNAYWSGRKYKLQDLGNLPGASASAAISVNRHGHVAGIYTTAAHFERGFVYTPETGMADLGTLGGTTTVPTRINDAGQIIGMSTTAEGASHGFLYTPGSGMADLTTLLSLPIGSLTGLNNQGQVSGRALDGPMLSAAFLYTPGTGVTIITEFRYAEAAAVNNAGQVVVNRGFPPAEPYLYTPGSGLVSLELPGGWSNGLATDLNDLERVVGYGSVRGKAENHAFLYIPGDKAVDLGTLGGSSSRANAINTSGQIAGTSTIDSSPTAHAFLYEPGGGMVDLNTLLIGRSSGCVLLSASDMNEPCSKPLDRGPRQSRSCGQIVGVGSFNGDQRAFLLTEQ